MATPKKQLLRPSNYSEEVWTSSFAENKAVLKMSQYLKKNPN